MVEKLLALMLQVNIAIFGLLFISLTLRGLTWLIDKITNKNKKGS